MNEITSPAVFAEHLNKILNTAKENNNQIQFSDMRDLLIGLTLDNGQVNQLWRFLDSNRILLFYIDEDDPLYQGVPAGKTITIADATAQEAASKKEKKGFFFRRK